MVASAASLFDGRHISGFQGTRSKLSRWRRLCSGDAIQLESLRLLEWPLVCEQVVRYCATPMGISASRNAKLPIGRCQNESQRLLAQTGDAQTLEDVLDFRDAKDVREVLDKALSGGTCNVQELCSVKDMLRCAQGLHEVLFSSRKTQDSALREIMQDLALCDELQEDIRRCLNCQLEAILDEASPVLASVRRQRKENMVALESLLRETGRRVMASGGMDTVTITRRRSRLCIAVKASYKSLLPGGVVLDTSNTGATFFMEPEPAIQLNNLDRQLAAEEQAAEAAVLERLTVALAEAAPDVSKLLEAITLLDLACARAKHAKWLDAVRPTFCTLQGVNIENIRHPILLASALSERRALPVPVDIKVKHGVKVVVVTGPNTGGKTVALKALGISAIMAKAGLYLPASGKAELPWFDHILADVGDSQSLVQNLSTFSGHIDRLCRIIKASTPSTLVLIDEIGGGTDPLEGSSLATAILNYLAKTVLLSLVTTHSALLKTLHDQDTAFENASVEFDMKTLRPTYRILWGIAGQSNALNIAETLEFDPKTLRRAKHWLSQLTPSGLDERQSKLMVQLSQQCDKEVEDARTAAEYLADAQDLFRELHAEAEGLDKRKAALKRQDASAMSKELSQAKSRMEAIVSTFGEQLQQGSKATAAWRAAQDAITAVVAEYASSVKDVNEGLPLPEVGDRVLIRRLGRKPATVLEPADLSGNLTVQLGTMKMRVKANELVFMEKQIPVKQRRPAFQLPEEERGEVKFGPAVQTSRNTVDLRGLTVADGTLVLQKELAKRDEGSVMFIIHGFGTRSLKTAVVSLLKKHPMVIKFEDESSGNRGCTIAYIAHKDRIRVQERQVMES